MTPEIPSPLPEACAAAQAALERDALELSAADLAHVRACPACAEARVLWLAQEDAPATLTPAGYFERLPGRVAAKLPGRPKDGTLRPWLWAAAGALLAAGLAGGYLAGRATRPPVVEASLPRTAPEVHEDVPEAPFQEKDDVLSKVDELSPEQLKALMDKLNDQPK